MSRRGAVPAACLAGVLAAGAPLAGCGIRPTGVIDAGDPPGAAAAAAQNVLYFVRNDRLVPSVRTGLPGHALLAIDQLLAGPLPAERQQGMTTRIPRGVSRDLLPEGAQVLLLRQRAPGANWSPLAKAQVACTAERSVGVEQVTLEYAAEPPDGERGRGRDEAIRTTVKAVETFTCAAYRNLQR